jgi:excisionase family DNA binding protein
MPALADRYDPLELLTLDELAVLLQVSRRHLERAAAAGELHTVKLGRSTRVPRAEAERYIQQHSNGKPK